MPQRRVQVVDYWRNWVFVFGSNQAGRHGRGAARYARQFFDAATGVGEGPSGAAYGIPTKDTHLKVLSLDVIDSAIARFAVYARQHPRTRFQITRIGCGFAGYSDEQIAPLFEAARLPDNCFLSGRWVSRSRPELMRVVVAGGRDFAAHSGNQRYLERTLRALTCKYPDQPIEFISGGKRYPCLDECAEQWGLDNGYAVTRFPACWRRYNKAAGPMRNQLALF